MNLVNKNDMCLGAKVQITFQLQKLNSKKETDFFLSDKSQTIRK